MSSFSSAKAEAENDEEYNTICEQYKQLLETLPKGNGWRAQYIYKYNGFWLNPSIMKTSMLLHSYFESRPIDIIMASYMKSGTTWLKALMFSTLNRHRYSFSNHPLHNQIPQTTFPILDIESYPITDFTNIPDPRLFATHIPRTLLPSCVDSCKFVYVCRDPKDVLISKWHFMNKLRSKKYSHLSPLSLDEAFEHFCQGVSEYGPFWEHVLSYWKVSLESPEKILFLKYEEMMKQTEVVVRKLAEFMGEPLTVEEEKKGVVAEIVKLCSFENLSNLEVNNKGVQKFGKGVEKEVEVEKSLFFRKGEIGDWKNYLSVEMKDRIDGITYDKFKGTGLMQMFE